MANHQCSILLSGGVPGSVLCYRVPDLHALQEHVRLRERHVPCGVPLGAGHRALLPGKLCLRSNGGKHTHSDRSLCGKFLMVTAHNITHGMNMHLEGFVVGLSSVFTYGYNSHCVSPSC